MQKHSSKLNQLLFQLGKERRWTQDSPILPDVWKALVDNPGERVDLLVTPHRGTRPGELATRIREVMNQKPGKAKKKKKALEESLKFQIAHNNSTVAVRANFEELITLLVPLSNWFETTIGRHLPEVGKYARYDVNKSRKLKRLQAEIEDTEATNRYLPGIVVWWLRLVGMVALLCEEKNHEHRTGNAILEHALKLLPLTPDKSKPAARLFRISLNRPLQAACLESFRTVKADAAEQVFQIDTARICWAILDTGIDARHPAFSDSTGKSRVIASYDFTKIRRLLSLASAPGDSAAAKLKGEFGMTADDARAIRSGLAGSGEVDWEALKPAIQIGDSAKARNAYVDGFTRKNGDVVPGISSHGTHVAGILAGRYAETDDGSFAGMCPDIRLIDLRVLDEKGRPGEFDVMAALQFVRHLNSASGELAVHGVNLSIQLKHDPQNFACGQTPVCEECDGLVSSGVVVVAAAGNLGIDRTAAVAATTEGAFRNITIADPGNAETVLTVGSTHRKRPHAYGVSFFSSRGPTGDGRQKPDLVAPGERILSSVTKAEYKRLDGTSQAAPHVSGAAALLMARHSELVGEPDRVKEILCNNATDLGREQHFQGAGLVDILRALQSV